jgi:dynein heavy chain
VLYALKVRVLNIMLDATQDHYDFGMRAVKSVLVMAGSLKRANPQLPEDVVLIRAMRDSNLPKFLVSKSDVAQCIVMYIHPDWQTHGSM